MKNFSTFAMFLPQTLRFFSCCVLLSTSLVMLGCGGPKPVNLEVKVVFPSSIKVEEKDSIQVRFIGEGDLQGKGGAGLASPSSLSFTSKELLPGKYKVSVQLSPYAGIPGSDKRSRALEPFNESFGEKKTPLSVDIGPEPEQKITVDLAKKSVSKN
jgi:hypothetical protein